jgi:hypothetical protein
MHITSVPLVITSLSYLIPSYIAYFQQNYLTSAAYGFLSTTSTLVHATKEPFYIYGPGNCNESLLFLDIFAVALCGIRILMDAWSVRTGVFLFALFMILYTIVIFRVGHHYETFVYDERIEISLPSHIINHVTTIIGSIIVLSMREDALKNG